MKPIRAAVVLTLMLTACSHENWTRPGASAGDTEAALQQCEAAADIAVGPEEGIDQDILATHGTDWQRSQIGGLAAGQLGQETHDRAGKIVTACMRGKGFTQVQEKRWLP
jgi:hypothetical protein